MPQRCHAQSGDVANVAGLITVNIRGTPSGFADIRQKTGSLPLRLKAMVLRQDSAAIAYYATFNQRLAENSC